MSLLVCCTGGKRHRRHKAATSKSCPPVERNSQPVDIRHTSTESGITDSTNTTRVLGSFNRNDQQSSSLIIKHEESVNLHELTPIQRDNTQISAGELSSNDTDNAETMASDVTHASLDHILAHLLNDISSPSFQRTSNVDNGKKTDENMNIHELFVPDVEANSLSSVRIFNFEPNSIDDYDIPCGASDEGVTQLSDYDVPPSPVLSRSLTYRPTNGPPTITVRKKENPQVVAADNQMNEGGYNTPRTSGDPYDDNDTVNHHSKPSSSLSSVTDSFDIAKQSAASDTSSAQVLDDTECGDSASVAQLSASQINRTTVVQSENILLSSSNGIDEQILSPSARSSCEIRSAFVERFKEVRLEVLTCMSHLLQTVGCADHTVDVKIANITHECSMLQASLLKFINFIQLLLDKAPQTDVVASTPMNILKSIQMRIDDYLEDVRTIRLEDINDVGAKLAGIIRITKDIPALLRTFAPLVELAVVGLDEKLSQNDEGSATSLKVTDIHESSEPNDVPEVYKTMQGGDEHLLHQRLASDGSTSSSMNQHVTAVQPVPSISPSNSDDSLLVTNTDDSPGSDLPSLPPKQKHKTSIDGVGNSQTSLTRSGCGDEHQNYDSDASLSHSSGISDKLLSISHTDLLDPGVDDRSHYEPVIRRKPLARPTDQENYETERISRSELNTPDVRASGVSQTTADQLEELRRQADSQLVHVHTDYTLFNEFNTTVSLTVSQLSDNDRRLLMFYCNQMANNWSVLDHAAGAFFNCMERRQLPKVFVVQSKFVILAGHKMTYIGDILAKNIEDGNAQDYIVSYSNTLCSSLKMAVTATKEAALKFPDIPKQQTMVDCIKDVTDWAIELKELVDRLTYIGQPEQILA